jgi:mRNA interferase MazF
MARPAVVVSSIGYNSRSPDVMLAQVTSRLNRPHPGDHVLADWAAAGLNVPSLIRAKIFTIEAVLVRRRIGTLTAQDMAAFDTCLRQVL